MSDYTTVQLTREDRERLRSIQSIRGDSNTPDTMSYILDECVTIAEKSQNTPGSSGIIVEKFNE